MVSATCNGCLGVSAGNKDKAVQITYVPADRCADLLQGRVWVADGSRFACTAVQLNFGHLQANVTEAKPSAVSPKRRRMRLAPSNGLSLTPSCFSTHATATMVLKTSELACQKHSRNRISRQTAESPEDRGQSCKRGCVQQFTISKLYEYSEVAQVSMKHSEHTDKAGKVAQEVCPKLRCMMTVANIIS